MSSPPTLKERDLLRHALGLRDGAKVALRNQYCAGTAEEAVAWRALVARGLAYEEPTADSPTDPIFRVREASLKFVLGWGESLDHEEMVKLRELEERLK